jgi:NTE family protein
MTSRGRDNTRIGIALGSGAARGWAHIGVLRALAAKGIEPGIVAGSSIGALVGAAYAAGQLDTLEAWCRRLTATRMLAYLDFSLLGGGLMQGEKLTETVREQIGDPSIESLSRRFGATATDLDSGQEVWFRDGPLLRAVRASMGIPGILSPVRIGGRWLVDGGLANPVPVSLCRAMGAQVVIAVNLNSDIVGKHGRNRERPAGRPDADADAAAAATRVGRGLADLREALSRRNELLLSRLLGKQARSPGLFEVLAGSINIMQDRITRARMAGDPPDIVLSPRLSELGLLEFDRARKAIAEGEASVASAGSELDNVLRPN